MMYKHRERFRKISLIIGFAFSKLRLSPNAWTLMSLFPALLAVYFLYVQNFLIAGVLFLVSAFLDMVDGSVARVTGHVTKLGAYLDTIVDRYVEGLIVIGLLFAKLPNIILPSYVWILLYFFGAFMTSYAKAAAKEKELVEVEVRGGLLERAERLIILFIGILLASVSRTYLVYVLILLTFLTHISALQRIKKATFKKALR